MKVSVTFLAMDKFFPLEVPEELELENFMAFCEVESGVPVSEMILLFNGKRMEDKKKTLKEYGVNDGEMLVLDRKAEKSSSKSKKSGSSVSSLDFSQIRIPSSSSPSTPSTSSASNKQEDDPAWIREMLRANPEQMAVLKQNNPRLADAVESGSLEEFANILKEQQEARAERERQRIRMLTADPFDMEAQRLIAQEIEKKNIEQNMELAMEYNPESFATVVMLYIDCVVNGHHIKAFVDSGAQATIMSQAAAKRCNIMRLVDRRWAGIAKGVGTQKIIGRVHMAQIQIKDDFLASSFSILEEQPMDMLLGLDMLKRHQCCIDLKKNVLVIGSTGTETPFLPESELPECARLSMVVGKSSQEDEDLAEALSRSCQDSESTKRLKSDLDIRPDDNFTEENIQTLIKYGFSREKCIEALRKNKGDMTQATAFLFANSLKF